MKAMLKKPLDKDLFSSIAEQLMSASKTVSVDGRVLAVQQTGRQKLRCVRFPADGVEYEAIEQNAAKPSRWGQLAREGHRVVQFRDVLSDRYVGVSVDGRVTIYGR
jgi:hypothetical protein